MKKKHFLTGRSALVPVTFFVGIMSCMYIFSVGISLKNVPTSKSLFCVSKIFMVMGPKDRFPPFLEIAKEVSKNHPVSFLYASFDYEIEDESAGCLEGGNQDDFLDCKTIFIPNTTWTEGRNLLAEEAVRKERKHGMQYKYWIFADDDLNMKCDGTEGVVDLNAYCWSKILTFFEGDDIPEKVTSISVLASGRINRKF